MNDTCIVTGGAGFIGCALSQGLTERFDRVIAVDILNPQIHPEPKRPDTLAKNVEFIHADICDGSFWDQLLAGVQGFFSVIHLAAETGTAQSPSTFTRQPFSASGSVMYAHWSIASAVSKVVPSMLVSTTFSEALPFT